MPGLEIERDDRFVARERVVHRVAVAVMLLAVVAGALGVFGAGPLTSATVHGDDFTVTFDRFARNGAPLQVTVRTTGPGTRACSSTTRCWTPSGSTVSCPRRHRSGLARRVPRSSSTVPPPAAQPASI